MMSSLIVQQRVMEIKSCAVYKTKGNVTTMETYVCDENEVCCENDGCCPIRTNKSYEAWGFWIFVLGVVLACYVLCWYCKKVEKNRQNARNVDLRNREVLPCRTAGGMDRLLEALILNYRSRLANQTDPIQNLDQIKVETSPPAYDEALHMPRPSHSQNVFDNVPSYDEAILK